MRKRPYEICQRKHLPQRLKAEIMLRQQGCCADCGTRLILGFFVFDHRPPLALRDSTADANDPDRLAAICWSCNELKTPKDLKEIAKSKRIAEKHQALLERQAEKSPAGDCRLRRRSGRSSAPYQYRVKRNRLLPGWSAHPNRPS